MWVCSKLAPGCTEQNKRKTFSLKHPLPPWKTDMYNKTLPSFSTLSPFIKKKKYGTTTVKLRMIPQVAKSNKRHLQSLYTDILRYPNSRTKQIWLNTDLRNKRFRQQRSLIHITAFWSGSSWTTTGSPRSGERSPTVPQGYKQLANGHIT